MSGCEVMRTSEAMWRGLEFTWIDEDESGSNRLAIHKYVDRDTHSVKPIGCDPQRWNVRGYICGDRLRDRVREFREALKRRGAGRLYDPWQNADFDVYAETWNFSFTKNILGAEFTATFVEAGEEPYPIATLSPLAAFADAIEQLETDSAEVFHTAFGVTNERAASVGSAISDAEAVWSYLQDSYRTGYQSGALIDFTGPDSLGVVAEAHDTSIATLFDQIDAVLDDTRSETFYTRNIFLDLGARDPNAPVASAVIENAEALNALVARTSFARLAAVLINQPYASAQHAQQAVDKLTDYANELTRFDDSVIAGDVQCILAVASQVPLGLPTLKTWTATKRQSGLALAHDIYCDIGRADELMTLNHALTALPVNPCYVAS